jgi:hypothetical protein
VEQDSHLLELLRYIHRNPVKAQVCSSVDEYPGPAIRDIFLPRKSGIGCIKGC